MLTGYHNPYPSVKVGTSTIFRILGNPIPGQNRAVTGGVDENAHQFPHVQDALDVDVSFSFSNSVAHRVTILSDFRPHFYLYGKVLTA
jgi:hypothetical protein